MATNDLYPLFAARLKQLGLTAGQQLVVALGGGVDSQSVLDLTCRYREQHPELRYLAIHLDHHFHPKSAAWADFLRDECARYQIPAIIEPLAVTQPPRQSKEARGREARYRRLAELTEPDAVILLGQHRNDQVETLMLQLKRGAGPAGLAAMAVETEFTDDRVLCRPVLAVTKDVLYQYARSRNLQWIEDDTNADTRIDRNFLRHEIIPPLVRRWPAFLQTASRSAELCGEQQALLAELVDEKLAPLQTGACLSLKGWQQQSPPLQRALLRRWLGRQGARLPSQARLQEIQRQIEPGQQVGVRWGHWQLRSFAGSLYLLPAELPHWQPIRDWDGQSACQVSTELPPVTSDIEQGAAVKVPAQAELCLRPARRGETFQPLDRSQPLKLNDLWKKAGIPPWARSYWPVLECQQHIIWAASLGPEKNWQTAMNQTADGRFIFPYFPSQAAIPHAVK